MRTDLEPRSGCGDAPVRAGRDRTSPNPPGLYIHIPFCIRKCPYCAFYSVTDLSLVPGFIVALTTELDLYRHAFPSFDTVYLGGGTPSVLTAGQIGTILDAVRRRCALADGAEITIEANPGDLNADLLSELKRMGVNRLNIGCQSFDDDALAFLGRRHTAGRARGAILAAREAGFSDLGLDLIYGLPAGIGGNPDAHAVWTRTLETALSFRPEHLSCYQLTVEARTPLAVRMETSGVTLPNEDDQARFFFETSERLEAAGYEHYEVSNFARGARHRSRHNRKYWDHTPYLGLGPAAHSFDGLRRWWNGPDVVAWEADLRAGRRPLAGEETLSAEERRLEALFLGLRTSDGIDLDAYRTRHGCDLRVERGAVIERLVAEGLARIAGNRLSPTRRGLACADAVARWLV